MTRAEAASQRKRPINDRLIKPYLKPENERYQVISMSDDAVICGVVKQVVFDVE